jgi:hypothetical protein
VSIKITIEKTTMRTWTAQENVVVKETPTAISKQNYGGGTEPMLAKEYAVREVTKTDSSRITLLEQVIENESIFDFAAVVKAINNLGGAA